MDEAIYNFQNWLRYEFTETNVILFSFFKHRAYFGVMDEVTSFRADFQGSTRWAEAVMDWMEHSMGIEIAWPLLLKLRG